MTFLGQQSRIKQRVCNEGLHSTVDPSVPTILRPWVRIPSTTFTFFRLNYCCWILKRTIMNKNRLGLAHLKKQRVCDDSTWNSSNILLSRFAFMLNIIFSPNHDSLSQLMWLPVTSKTQVTAESTLPKYGHRLLSKERDIKSSKQNGYQLEPILKLRYRLMGLAGCLVVSILAI